MRPPRSPRQREAPPALPPLIVRHLDHLRIQRRLAERTLAMYGDAFRRLDVFCANEGLDLTAARPHHVRGWTARLHAQGLGPRSIAITLAGWRGLYKWLGREGLVRLNPVEGIKPPKAPKPLPKALPVDQAVALASHQPADPSDTAASPAAATRAAREGPLAAGPRPRHDRVCSTAAACAVPNCWVWTCRLARTPPAGSTCPVAKPMCWAKAASAAPCPSAAPH